MITLIAAVLVIAPNVGPVVPAGATEAFLRTALEVQTLLEAQRWADAAKAADRLPKPEFQITWDDAKVPPAQRAAFQKARDAAIEHWTSNLKGVQIQTGKAEDVQIAFVDALPPNADSPGPAGATFFRGVGAGEPRVEALIALHRGESRLPITPLEVQNEVAFAIGAYLGLERTPTSQSVMGRHESPYAAASHLSNRDLRLARELLGLAQTLRSMAANKVRIVAARPQLALDPSRVERPPMLEGDRTSFSIQITNQGNAPLSLSLVADCGCMAISGSVRTVEAGQTVAAPVRLDTTNFPGPFEKSIYVYSNDPEEPVRRVRVQTTVRPRFRILRDDPGRVLIVPDDGLKIEVFLAISDEVPMKLTSARVDGMKAMVSFEEWSGERADPELGEGHTLRKGYRIRLLSGLEVPPGRVPLTLVLATDDPVFPVIRHTMFLQRGIAALPGSVYLGEMGKSPATATFIVTRPGKGFKITGVACDAPYLSGKVEAVREDWEYRVVLTYDGKADYGEIATTVTVRTDDPKQPEIVVPVTGRVQ